MTFYWAIKKILNNHRISNWNFIFIMQLILRALLEK